MTYPAVQTFWMEPTDTIAWGLRRYSSSDGAGFDCEHGYHQALVYLERRPAVWREDDRHGKTLAYPEDLPHDDPRWPTVCQACGGYEFIESDHWQGWQELIYRRPSDGQEYVLHSGAGADNLDAPAAPPGAMWDAWWMPFQRQPDGLYLIVRLPNSHDWHVDSSASNCTRPGEPHQCWVRHGDPRTEPVTVDKNGDTCAAGAGSIQGGDYHGFLQNGVLSAG
jgi:hypothetical protein